MFPGHKIKELALEDRYVLILVSSLFCVLGRAAMLKLNFKLLSDACDVK